MEEEPGGQEKNEGGTEEDIKKVKKRTTTTEARGREKSGRGKRQMLGRPVPTDLLYDSADDMLRGLAAQLDQAQRLSLYGPSYEGSLRTGGGIPSKLLMIKPV